MSSNKDMNDENEFDNKKDKKKERKRKEKKEKKDKKKKKIKKEKKKEKEKDGKNEKDSCQKRKYTRKQNIQMKAHDNTSIQPIAKKRGRKKGIKDNKDSIFKPDEILDYMIRNFPEMGIERIKEKVLIGLKVMKDIEDNPYLLDKFIHNNVTYYYDDKNAIFNTDGKVIGFFIKQPNVDNDVKIYHIESNRDARTYEEIINFIENN